MVWVDDRHLILPAVSNSIHVILEEKKVGKGNREDIQGGGASEDPDGPSPSCCGVRGVSLGGLETTAA